MNLVLSCYELGHQPHAAALLLGLLEQANIPFEVQDLSVDSLNEALVSQAQLIAISTPMHTALRLALSLVPTLKKLAPQAKLIFWGHYAQLNKAYVLSQGVDVALSGEAEEEIVALAKGGGAFSASSEATRSSRGTRATEGNDDQREEAYTSPTSITRSNKGTRATEENDDQREEAYTPPTRITRSNKGTRATEGNDNQREEAYTSPTRITGSSGTLAILKKLSFVTPQRAKLPELSKYARLSINGANLLAGYTETSRGCLHHCTHCPIPAVYQGRFFVIPREVVIEDVSRQVQMGAEHITFGDPDFFNGPKHAMSILRELHQKLPWLTFDFTAKVEHLLKYSHLFPELVHSGVVFIVSAFESLSDAVLEHLKKNHSRSDIEALLRLADAADLVIRPTWVPFTPWTSLEDMVELFGFIEEFSLIENIDPIQYGIRLLIPPGSLLLQDKSLNSILAPLEEEALLYPWRHPNPALDQLAKDLQGRVAIGAKNEEEASETFFALREITEGLAQRQSKHPKKREERGKGLAGTGVPPRRRPKKPIPRLTEAWFC